MLKIRFQRNLPCEQNFVILPKLKNNAAMFKKITIPLLIIFILFPYHAESQILVIQEEVKKEKYLVKTTASEYNFDKKYILKKIGEGMNRHINNVQFAYSYNEHTEVLKDDNEFEFIAYFNNFRFTGNKYYRGIALGDVLFPNQFDFKLLLTSPDDDIIFTKDYSNIKIKENEYFLHFSFTDTIYDKIGMQITDKEFKYDNKNRNDFDKKVALIDEYYQQKKLLDQKFNELRSLDLQEFEKLYQFLEISKQNEKWVQDIKTSEFYNELNLDINDPARLKSAVELFRNSNQEKQQEIEKLIAQLPEIYYNQGIDLLTKGRPELAEKKFVASINENDNYAPSHYQLAELDYERGNYENSIDRLERVIEELNADVQVQQRSYDLAAQILDDYIYYASVANDDGKYDEAIPNLDKAKVVCHTISGLNSPPELEKEYAIAVKGKFHSYLTEAKELIKQHQADKANELIQKAKSYQKGYQQYIPDLTDMEPVIIHLYNEYIYLGKIHNKNKNYQQALQEFKKAENICLTENHVECNHDISQGKQIATKGIYYTYVNNAKNALEENRLKRADNEIEKAINYRKYHELKQHYLEQNLLEKIKQQLYNQLISEGKIFFNQSDYQQSLMHYSKAQNMQNSYSFIKKDDFLDNHISASVRAIVKNLTQQGQQRVAANNLEQAREYYRQALDIVEQHQQNENEETMQLINDLKQKIFTRECRNLQQKYDTRVEEAMQLCNDQKYIDAEKVFIRALAIAERKPACELSTEKTKVKLEEIKPAVEYQEERVKVERFIRDEIYNKAIELYNYLTQFYQDNNLNSFNLNHLDLYDFISKQRSNFVNYAVWYYAGQEQFEKSLGMLYLLKQRNYNFRNTKKNQEFLGEKLAINDYSSNPNTNFRDKMKTYTKGDRWFRFLKRAYRKKWRKLD